MRKWISGKYEQEKRKIAAKVTWLFFLTEFSQTLGEGAFAIVKLGKLDGSYVAVKILKKELSNKADKQGNEEEEEEVVMIMETNFSSSF